MIVTKIKAAVRSYVRVDSDSHGFDEEKTNKPQRQSLKET